MAGESDKVTTMNVSLPEALRAFVEGQVAKGYSSISEYVRELIRRDQKEAAQAALEAKLLDALDSPLGEMSADDWQGIRDQVTRRHKKRGGE